MMAQFLTISSVAEAEVAAQPAFHFWPPPPSIAPFVEYLYASRIPRSFAAVAEGERLPEMSAQLVFVLEEGTSFPGSQRAHGDVRASLFLQVGHIDVVSIPRTIREAVGASLRPEGLALLVPRWVHDGSGAVLIPLDELIGPPARDLTETMVEQPSTARRVALLRDFLVHRARTTAPPGLIARRAAGLIAGAHGAISIAEVARACGCTERTLHKATLASTGLTPKHLARIARARHLLDVLRRPRTPLVEAAVACGFSDQAHMTRECRALFRRTAAEMSRRIQQVAWFSERVPSDRPLLDTCLALAPSANAAPRRPAMTG
ncbi:helix-turn-helix transcriptional regulator [Sorangium sp. So ce233]|uniref:helix-turn-helix transcriptional regulator n=1 Tax=Sorangium sp. So ce233 TaxID=3133290 RepID=UPI003F62A6EE